jgi:hypothetical protein
MDVVKCLNKFVGSCSIREKFMNRFLIFLFCLREVNVVFSPH